MREGRAIPEGTARSTASVQSLLPQQGAALGSERLEECAECWPQARLQLRGCQFISTLQRAVVSAGNRQLRAADQGSGVWQSRRSCSYSRGKHLPIIMSRPWAAGKGRSFLEGEGRRQGWHPPCPTELPGCWARWARPTEHPEGMVAAPTSRTFAVFNICLL